MAFANVQYMPRKPLKYTDEYPYHIVARANNREWFKVNIETVWEIFTEELRDLNIRYNFQIHCFTLMSNHYHLLASCSRDYDLGFIMRILQTKTSRRINYESGRINHVYGARYRASLVTTEIYYAIVLKYILRNPISAGMCDKVEEWRYQTLGILGEKDISDLPLSSQKNLGKLFYSMSREEKKHWLHESFEQKSYEKIRKSLKRSYFKLTQLNRPLTHLL